MKHASSNSNSSKAKRDVASGRGRSRWPSSRTESTIEIMERLLFRQVSLRIDGEAQEVAAVEAIVLQLTQKALAGKARSWRALLKFQEFANRGSVKSAKLHFVESDYTRSIARSPSSGDDD